MTSIFETHASVMGAYYYPTHPVYAALAAEDVATLRRKDAEYGSSWKKRGGVGAFMMLARKYDRLEKLLDQQYATFGRRDLVEAMRTDVRQEGVRDDVGDLRRYLLLVYVQIWTTVMGDETHFMDTLLQQAAEGMAAYATGHPAILVRRGEATDEFLARWRELEAWAANAGWDAFQLDRTLHLATIIGRLYAIEVGANI